MTVPNNKAERVIERFQSFYDQSGRGERNPGVDKGALYALYDDAVIFEDSFHRIEGVAELLRYFDGLYESLTQIQFVFHDYWPSGARESRQSAMLTWTMTFGHRRLNRGRPISVDGSSLIHFNDKVYYHRDYFDGGQLLYEHVPLLGTLIKKLKQRMV